MSIEQIPDLWSDAIVSDSTASARTYLKVQAAALGQRTKNLVVGGVDTKVLLWDNAGSELVTHQFFVSAPALQYRRVIFEMGHAADELFPVSIRSDFLDIKELTAANEQLLSMHLRSLLQDPKVVRLIQVLCASSS